MVNRKTTVRDSQCQQIEVNKLMLQTLLQAVQAGIQTITCAFTLLRFAFILHHQIDRTGQVNFALIGKGHHHLVLSLIHI